MLVAGFEAGSRMFKFNIEDSARTRPYNPSSFITLLADPLIVTQLVIGIGFVEEKELQ